MVTDFWASKREGEEFAFGRALLLQGGCIHYRSVHARRAYTLVNLFADFLRESQRVTEFLQVLRFTSGV